MQLKSYTFTQEELTACLNLALEVYLNRMNQEKIIDTDTFSKLSCYRIVSSNKGFFGTVFDKLLGLSDDTARVTIVKIIPDET